VLFLLLVGVIAGCAVNPVTGQSELMLVSEEQELALGRQAYPSLIWQDGGPYQDPQLHRYLSGIVRRLHAASHRPNLPVDFTIENSSVPNAWAIPGHTAINRALLVALENEAQFAFVMGHEMGHVTSRHSAQRQTYGTLAGLGALMAQVAVETQRDPRARQTGEVLVGLGMIGTSLVLLKYDRGQETQADHLGVLYMARAGYDPREAVAAHQSLQRAVQGFLAARGEKPGKGSFLDGLLSTHPRGEVRIQDVAQVAKELPSDLKMEGDGKFRDRWLAQTAGIHQAHQAYLAFDQAQTAYLKDDLLGAERHLTAALRRDDRQPPFDALRGAIQLRQDRVEDALGSFQRALSLDPGFQPAIHGLGAVLFVRQDYRGAIPSLHRSLEIFPDFVPSHYLLGLAYSRLGQHRQALPHLKVVAEASPKHPMIHGLLADALERSDDIRGAYAAYQAQLQVAPDSELGQRARQRVGALRTSLSTPYSSRSMRLHLTLPGGWRLTDEREGRQGGEAFQREAPPVLLRVASTDFDAPQSVEQRLDEWIDRAMRGEGYRVTGVERNLSVAGQRGIVKEVDYRSRGETIERTFIAFARGGRVYWIDIAAAREARRDREVREELNAILRSLSF
jgi:predicted Zn-dependent protease